MPIAKLSIDLEARLGQFETEMKRISSVADGLSNKLTSAFKGVGLAAVGLAGIGSFAALKGSIDSAIGSMADLKDAAERTGSSVEKLSGLKSVAKIGGRDFADVETAITRLNKALHATDDESKGAGKALAAIGLDVQKLRSMDPADAMLEIAKAQEKFADGSGKAAAMMAIFGKAGAQMIPFLKDLAEQQQLLGKVTTEQALAADEYEKNVRRLTGAWGTLSKQMAATVVGPAKDITDWMIRGQKEGGALEAVLLGIGAATVKAFGGEINPLARAEKSANEAFAKLGALRKQLEVEQQTLADGKGLDGLTGGFLARRKIAQIEQEIKATEKSLRSAISLRNKLLGQEADASEPKSTALNSQNFGATPKEQDGKEKRSDADAILKSLSEQIAVKQLDLDTTDKLTEVEREAAKIRESMTNGTLKLTDSERDLINAKLNKLAAIDKEITAQNAIAKATEDYNKAIGNHFAALEEEAYKQERLAEFYGLTQAQVSAITQARLEEAIAIAKANGASEEQIAFLEKELELRGRITDAMSEVDRKAQEVKDRTKDSNDAARELGMTFTSAFEDAIVNGKKFSDVLKGLMQDIARILIRKSVTEPIAGGIGDFAKDFDWSTIFTPNAKGGVYSSPSLSAYSGGVYSSPRLFAFANGAGVFGEAGPEAIMPLKRGRDGKLGVQSSGGGGGDVNISVAVDAKGTQAEGSKEGAAELGRRIGAAVRSVLIDEKRPGGLLAA